MYIGFSGMEAPKIGARSPGVRRGQIESTPHAAGRGSAHSGFKPVQGYAPNVPDRMKAPTHGIHLFGVHMTQTLHQTILSLMSICESMQRESEIISIQDFNVHTFVVNMVLRTVI